METFGNINIISALSHVKADTQLKNKSENNQKREQKCEVILLVKPLKTT
jgi:hypothetical protein